MEGREQSNYERARVNHCMLLSFIVEVCGHVCYAKAPGVLYDGP